MEPVYEFDNKDIKEHRDIISHNCRLLEAQSISFLLYLDSKIDEEQDLVKKEKLRNIMSSFSSQIDETTKLKSELLESYKVIDSTYTDLRKMGFGNIIEEYYLATNVREQIPLVNNDKEVVNEVENVIEDNQEMVSEPEMENTETYDEPMVEEPVEVEEEPVMVEEAEQEMTDDAVEEPVMVEDSTPEMGEYVEEGNEENVSEEEPVAVEEEPVMVEETDDTQEEPVLVEESSDEVVTEDVAGDNIEADEDVVTEADGDNIEADEAVEEPVIINEENSAEESETVEEPVLVEETNNEEQAPEEATENTEDNSEAVLIPTVDNTEETSSEEVTDDAPTAGEEPMPEAVADVVIPAIDNTGAAEEEQAIEEVAEEEPAAVEEAVQAEAEAAADVAIPVVEEETKEEEQPTQEQTAEVDESLDKYVKSDNNPVSRILVTEGQYNELKKSLPQQEALLSARERTKSTEVGSGVPETEEDPQARIEKMMEEANQLYQSGDAAGAQALYEQISAENEKLKEQQLVK